MMRFLIPCLLTVLSCAISWSSLAQIRAVDLYSQEKLLKLIQSKRYLDQVRWDDCQLVQDIEARAEKLKQPLYQFLWGEMLNYGICVNTNPSRGMAILHEAAMQGSPDAMVKMAEYYHQGKFVIKDDKRALRYLYPAAMNGDVSARIMLVQLLTQGVGNPSDFELAYHWLYNSVFDDEQTQKIAQELLQSLSQRMPLTSVARAKREHRQTY